MAVKLIKSNKKVKENNLPLVIGYFGSIHVMHQQLLTKYHEFNVLTFTDLISKRQHQIYNYDQRIDNLKRYHPKNIYVLDISSNNMPAKKFIKDVLLPLNPSVILVGEDFKFGFDHARVKLLKDYFKVLTLNYNKDISTKKIHELIVQGKIDEANDYMAFYLYYKGKWISGKKIGRQLGYPTINLQNKRPFMLPEGSYATLTTLGNKKYMSVTFVGNSKTINKTKIPLVETHIINRKLRSRGMYSNFTKNNIVVEFFKFLRKNMKFDSFDELKQAIAKDILKAKQYFKDKEI